MNILKQRQIRSAFSRKIILNDPEVDLDQAIRTSIVVDQATKAMVSGKISPEEVLEWVEPHMNGIIPMDDYIEEVENRLSLILSQ